MSRRLLDLAVQDVHQPSAPEKKRTMATLPAKKRKTLPNSAFADPRNRAYPVHDKAHADNAMARLEQQKGKLTPAQYRAIKRRIQKAQKGFGEKPKGTRMRGGYGFQLS